MRAVLSGGLDAYIRIARILCHLHHIAILCHETSSSCKSPASPALNACGVTSVTILRAASWSSGSAAHNTRCSHRLRSVREARLPLCGRKTNSSPARHNALKCHVKTFAAVRYANTLPSSPRTAYFKQRHRGPSANDKTYRRCPWYRCQSVGSRNTPSASLTNERTV